MAASAGGGADGRRGPLWQGVVTRRSWFSNFSGHYTQSQGLSKAKGFDSEVWVWGWGMYISKKFFMPGASLSTPDTAVRPAGYKPGGEQMAAYRYQEQEEKSHCDEQPPGDGNLGEEQRPQGSTEMTHRTR